MGVDEKEVFRCSDFPNDGIVRVIFAHGPLIRNQMASVPRVEIHTRRLVDDKTLGEEEIFRVGAPDLVKIKIGTIWKGCEHVDGDIWRGWKEMPRIQSYIENIPMSFDLRRHPPETYVLHKNTSTKKLEWLLHDYPVPAHIRHSTMTKLVLKNRKVVMIPSMELLTSTYTPRHARITNDLLSMNHEELMKKWIDDHECFKNSVKLKTESNHYDETLFFLSSLACREKVRSSVSKIYSSVQASRIQREDGSLVSYPVVHPYDPVRFDVVVSGVWFNTEEDSDKEIFFVQRIEKFIPRAVFEVIHESESEESSGLQDELPPASIPRVNKDEIPNDLSATSESDPGSNAGRKHIRSSISVDTSNIRVKKKVVKKITEAKKRTHPPQKTRPSLLSSGHLDGSMGSQNVGQVHYIGKDEKSDFDVSSEEKPTINPLGLEDIVRALEFLEKKKEVHSNMYIDSGATEHFQTTFCAYDPSYIEIDGERSFWVSRTRKSDPEKTFKPRRLLIAKISFTDYYDPLYLLEIERKSESESFWGVLFASEGQALGKTDVNEIMKTVARNKGRFISRKSKGAGSPTELPVKEVAKYKHLRGKSIEEILREKIDLFLKCRLFRFQKTMDR